MNDIEVESTVGERVLIVEDDPATRSGLAELVQAWGFQTAEAADGEEAMRKVTTFRPGDHRVRSRHAANGRFGTLAGAERSAERYHLHPPDGARHCRQRGRGDQRRRIRLFEQAGRAATSADPPAEGGRTAGHAARGARTPSPVARTGELRPDHRQQSRDSHRVSRDRAVGADRRIGPDIG